MYRHIQMKYKERDKRKHSCQGNGRGDSQEIDSNLMLQFEAK